MIQALQAGASLVAVLALVLLAGAAARKRWPGAAIPQDSHALRLRATLVLDARRRLYLVESPAGAALILTGGGRDQIAPFAAAAGPGPVSAG
jgi:flagellar biogenesis protein FliO